MSEDQVLELVSEILGVNKHKLNQEDTLYLNGWDSLSTLTLLAKIDSLNLGKGYTITIDDETTVRDLVSALA